MPSSALQPVAKFVFFVTAKQQQKKKSYDWIHQIDCRSGDR
jgi:hypothetical protein